MGNRAICGAGVRSASAWGVLLLLAVGSGCSGRAVSQSTKHFPPGTGFSRHEVLVDGKPHAISVFIPRDYRAGQPRPAVLFLHGLFECGSDGERCLSAGLGPVIARAPESWPFITIFPQSTGTWRGEERDRVAIASLDYAQQHWSIDSNRVTLAGLSYGGLGTWEIGARHADRFAALVPVAGFRSLDSVARIGATPVWAFNYSADLVVPADNSAQMCEQLNARGGNAKLTEFAGIGHDAWDRAVADSDLVEWMLAQRRAPAGNAVAQNATAVARAE
jgi:predicted peptidase